MNAATSTVPGRFLTFEVDGELFALPAQEVAEVMRLPTMARVPQGPPALLGIANLRGSVLPVASLRAMLGRPTQEAPHARAIVLDIGAPAAVVVDAVATLESAITDQVTHENAADAAGAEKLQAAFVVAGSTRVARVLDIRAMLDAAFARRAITKPQQRRHGSGAAAVSRRLTTANSTDVLVTFEVAGQEFALPLSVVQEILPAPANVTLVARAEAAVLGITTVRDRLLPLLSLRTLLGFTAAATADEGQKVVVLKMGESQVGLVADRVCAIIAADSTLVDPVPPVLAARTGGESRIRSVYRGDGGQRLISILSPEQLFRNEVMQRLTQNQHTGKPESAPSGMMESRELIFLVFRLGDDEFGLPIDTVVEVAQVPEQITRVPRTPKFLEGVINLRGEVLPIVDQRRRFDMPKLDSTAARKLVVVQTARHRAGLVVDDVSSVLRTFAGRIEPPPELTDATSRLVSGVLNLETSKRIVLLLDPGELLTRAEHGLLDTFAASRKKADA